MDREMKKKVIATVILLVFFASSIAFALIYAFPGGPKYVHWHAQLNIIIEGQQINIPANVGIASGDGHPAVVHTHDTDNILHKEGPDTLALGNFFEVWGRTFNSECIFDYCNGNGKTMKMTVNGIQNYEFENYVFKDKDVIVIEYS